MSEHDNGNDGGIIVPEEIASLLCEAFNSGRSITITKEIDMSWAIITKFCPICDECHGKVQIPEADYVHNLCSDCLKIKDMNN